MYEADDEYLFGKIERSKGKEKHIPRELHILTDRSTLYDNTNIDSEEGLCLKCIKKTPKVNHFLFSLLFS